MNKLFLSLVLAMTLVGCTTVPPAIIYQPQEVKIAVPVFVDAPVVDKFQSSVLELSDTSTDGQVGQAYKSDWLSLMYRDHLFTDFLIQYKKAKDNAQAGTSGK